MYLRDGTLARALVGLEHLDGNGGLRRLFGCGWLQLGNLLGSPAWRKRVGTTSDPPTTAVIACNGSALCGPATALSLRSVGIFGPVGRARAIELVGFFALMARSWRRKLWAHELPDCVRLEVFGTL